MQIYMNFINKTETSEKLKLNRNKNVNERATKYVPY